MVAATLEGRSLELFSMTMFFTITCAVIVTLRISTRMSIRGFGLDDALMVVGELIASGLFIIGLLACKAGLGNHDKDLVAADAPIMAHYIFAAQVLYIFCMVFIKSSICVALVRLATKRTLLYILYANICFTICSNFITLVVLLSHCQPIHAAWDGKGKCGDPAVLIKITYFTTASSVVTDVVCSTLPFVILWNLQMRRSLKFSVSVMLSLGLLATAATISRLPYISAYKAKVNASYKLQRLVLFIVLETSVAIIVGSIPSLKPLVNSIAFFSSQKGSDNLSYPRRRPGATNTRIDNFDNSYPLKSVAFVHSKAAKANEFGDDNNSLRMILGDGDENIHISKQVQVTVKPNDGSRKESGSFSD